MMMPSWAKLLQPNLVLGRPIVALDAEILRKYQLKGLVLDVDDTLVPIRTRNASPELLDWVREVRGEVTLWLASNNLDRARIEGIARDLDVPYIFGARKPSRRKLRQATDAMNLPISQIAMVGDRLFTDVLAGNRLGMFTILVEPMVDPVLSASPGRNSLRRLEVWISQKLGASL